MIENTGRVGFIDFGPGEPGLITVQGLAMLRNAGALLYDDSAPGELVLAAAAASVIHYIGRHGNGPTTPAETAELLEKLARDGRLVVRLFGGEPLPTERIGEEISCLQAHGIPVEVISARPPTAIMKPTDDAPRPLAGLRIMITRAADQADELCRRLRELGAVPMLFPTIATEPLDDEDGWERFDQVDSDNGWLVFTSENGVRYFFRQYAEEMDDLRVLAQFNIAAVGSGTADALREHLLSPDFIPSKATVDDLAQEMIENLDLQDAVVVRVRGDLADDTLEKRLPKAGATVTTLTVYRTEQALWPDGFKARLFDQPPHAILFTSGLAVDGLYKNLEPAEVDALVAGANIFSIGPTASRSVEAQGLTITRQADPHTIPGLVDTLIDYYRQKK